MVCCSSYALADAALAQEHPEETEPEFDFVEQTVKVTGINRLWSLVQDHERHKEENNDQMDITIGEKKLKDAFAKYAKVIGTALSTDSVDIDGETWGLITFSHSSSSQLLMLGQQTATVRVDGFNDGTWGKKNENGTLSLLENEDATPMHVALARLARECDDQNVMAPKKIHEEMDTCYEIIKLLIRNGANVDALDRTGASAVMGHFWRV